jgi:hypothetical protein
MIIVLSITLVLAICLVIQSVRGVIATQHTHRSTRPYILPAMIGLCYVLMIGLVLIGGNATLRGPVEVVLQLMQGLLILSVMITLHELLRKRAK